MNKFISLISERNSFAFIFLLINSEKNEVKAVQNKLLFLTLLLNLSSQPVD